MPFRDYDINWKRLVRWNVFAHLLKPKQLNWLNGLVNPIVLLHTSFLQYRKAKLYQLMITSQVCYLEMLLRDRFDFILRRIVIVDAEWKDPIYIFLDDELKDVYLFDAPDGDPQWLFTDEESGDIRVDFIVEVPVDISFSEAEMRAMINSNICGKRYKIEIV